MKCSEIIEILRENWPDQFALDWDNVGLLAGRRDREVTGIYVGLDATEQVIEGAVSAGCNMLLTHHPLLFSPVKQVSDSDFVGNRLLTMIEHGISYYAMHTSYDSAPGCMADQAAAMLYIEDGEPLELVSGPGEPPCGIGKVGHLAKEITIDQLCARVKEKFRIPALKVFSAAGTDENGEQLRDRPLRRIAVSPGSGKSMIQLAIDAGAQALVTGDIGHHEGIDGAACGITVIDAGHYGLEHIFISHVAGYLREQLGKDVKIVEAEFCMPYRVV